MALEAERKIEMLPRFWEHFYLIENKLDGSPQKASIRTIDSSGYRVLGIGFRGSKVKSSMFFACCPFITIKFKLRECERDTLRLGSGYPGVP